MATFGDIPSSMGFQPGFSVRRNFDDTTFETFDASFFLQSDVDRNLDEVFQVSTTDHTLLSYSVDITAVSTLLAGQSSTVFLEISSDPEDGFVEMARFTHGISGVVASSTTTGNLVAAVNAGWYVRLRTTGNATVTYRSGQEVGLVTLG